MNGVVHIKEEEIKQKKYAFEGIFTRSLNSFERVVSPLSEKYDQLEFSTNKYSALTSSRRGLASGYGLTSVEKKTRTISFNRNQCSS